ncbi:MAG: flagellar assembly peptidoglycan hydrolase FlgJ [Rhodocyclaceae bacterium]|nr:flagellar assembly peptidoglycan hydrolase FlgJ [Rhodocyclaceae bacterium]
MNPSVSSVDPSIFDTGGLASIKRNLKSNDPKAIKGVAQQFEALFMQMVLKSMRDATPREGMFDSEQTRLFESLQDQQLALSLSTKSGTGLAAMIEKQLSRSQEIPQHFEQGLPLIRENRGRPLEPVLPTGMPINGPSNVPAAMPLPISSSGSTPKEFVARVWNHAVEASQSTGIPAHFMVAQAALETGWGRSEPRMSDGGPSYNLFGIKATRNWTGPVAESLTTEVEGGLPIQKIERFRAYGSYAEAFRDYAHLLTSNPRYAEVVGNQDAAGFARGLQRAGYATDPMYAAKLERIITGTSLREALAG